MATLLLHKNRFLRAFALLGALALIIGVQSSARPSAAGSAATSIEIAMTQSCGGGVASYTFSANGIAIGTATSTNTCDCHETVFKQTFAVPAGLAGLQPGAAYRLQQNGNSQITAAKVTVNRADGPESICLRDLSGRNCATEDSWQCHSNVATTNLLLGPVTADTDGDAVNNSLDLDWDGDGIANASDNCSLISNASQSDTDSNGVGDVCQMALVTVPWQGSETLAHQVYSGASIVLQASFSRAIDGVTFPLASATWDAGDGGGQVPVSFANPRVIEMSHPYTGSIGQPFTATVRATDTAGNTYSDTFKVVIAANSRETKVNMAIDKALWNLHKRIVFSQSDGQLSGYWQNFGSANIRYIERIAATASSVQALEINNHRESGDATKDPYVTDVRRGLRFLLSSGHGALQRVAIGLQGVNNPDTNGNGYGLVVSQTLSGANAHQAYVSGQVVDAIVASGTPNKTADVGQATYVAGRTYHDIVQDMLDGYSWGLNETRGGWNYNYNDGASNDTSASHWWGIAVLAAQVWNLDAPSWVKSLNWNTGVPIMQIAPPQTDGCYFGYTNSYTNHWGDSQTNVTAAGLILINADGIARSHARFTCAEKWLATKFNTAGSFGNYYTMYQTAKAMRTATDGAGNTTPITMLNGTIDWYAAYADYLISVQDTAGAFISTQGSIGSYLKDDLATSWGVIILSPSLFEVPPTAACTATPATIGFNGGNVNFSAAASSHVDPTALPLTYAWSFGDASSGSGVTTSHNYAAHPELPVGGSLVQNATVLVTDVHGNSATASCPVTITRNNVPPSVSTSGPYTMCVGSSLTVTGFATDEDGTIGSTGWDLNQADGTNFNVIDATGFSVDVTTRFTTLGPGTYDIGFQATDNSGATSGIFSTVTVLAANNAACNQPPVANDDNASTLSGTAVTINVLSNDTDPNAGNTLSTTSATNGANGSTAVNGGGTVTYTPNTGFAGTDTFTYTISDGLGGTDTATVTVTVTKRTVTATATGGTFTYDDFAHGGSCSFTGSDGANLTGTLSYSLGVAQVNVSSNTVTCSFNGTGTNYASASDTDTVVINPATSVTVVTCPPSVVYNGAAQTVCTANVTGVGGLNQAVTPVAYANNVNVGTATATASYLGDANHTSSADDATFAITPAATATVVTCADAVFTGAAQTTCSANVTGADGLNQVLPVSYLNNVNVGTATGSASYTPDANHQASNSSATFEITKAPSVTVMTCPASVVYSGAAQTPCSANVTGVGGLNQAVTPVTYATNTNVGTASANATFTGDLNHSSSTDGDTFAITLAPSVTVVTCTPSVVYNATAQEVCSANVTGVGGLNQAVTPVTYTANTNVGTASANATFTGDLNHSSSTDGEAFEITPAPSVTVVTCPTSLVYTGAALTPCTANVTGVGGLDQAVTPVTYTANTNVGTAGASATFGGDANHTTSTGGATFEITQAATSTAINAPTITVAANGAVTVTVASGSGTVLGNVSLTVDGGAAMTQALVGGSTVFTVASPNAGDHALVASYAAQGNFSASGTTGNLHVNPSPTATVLTTSATPQLAGTPVTFTAAVVATAPGSGTPNGIVTFLEGATVLGTGTLDGAGVATFTTSTLSNGPHTITASYNGVNNYLPSQANTVSKLIFGLATGGGTFVIGNNNAVLNNQVLFWGAQWEKNNSMTGGASNASFKGFAISPAVPTVGATFTSAPGNSAPPPAGVPQYLGIIVTSKVTKSGSNITGTIVKLVVVKVDAGYQGNPGHAGTGTIVAFVQ